MFLKHFKFQLLSTLELSFFTFNKTSLFSDGSGKIAVIFLGNGSEPLRLKLDDKLSTHLSRDPMGNIC